MKIKILYYSIIGLAIMILLISPLLLGIIIAIFYYYPRLKTWILREGMWVKVKGKSGKIIYINSGWYLIETLDGMETVKSEEVKWKLGKLFSYVWERL